MALAVKEWTPVCLHRVVLAWLRAERNSHLAGLLANQPQLLPLLDQPDIEDPDQNRMRLRVLYFIRGPFVLEIPPDTAWHRVENLTHAEISELRAVHYGPWSDSADQNELVKVAARRTDIELNVKEFTRWEPPILWSHDRMGPFTILEGNHRLTGYVRSGRNDLDIPVFIGLSRIKCVYHLEDQSGQLIRDILGI